MAYGKQIEFPAKQTHVKAFEIGMLVFSIICVVDRAVRGARDRHRERVPSHPLAAVL